LSASPNIKMIKSRGLDWRGM